MGLLKWIMEYMHLSSNQFMSYWENKYNIGDTIHNWNKKGIITDIKTNGNVALITLDVKSE